MNRLAAVTCIVAAGLILVGSGCSRGITEGMGVVRGGKGDYNTLSGPQRALGQYDSIEVEEFIIAYDPTPSTLPAMVRTRLIQDLRDKNQPVGMAGDDVLIVRGRIIYYERGGGVDHVWGPLEEAVAIVSLVDRASGVTVAQAGCVGRSNASVSVGVESKADGLAEAVANWIDQHRPTP